MLSEREKMIGARLRAFRELLQIPRTKFALSIGCGSEQIAAYESGRARLPYRVFNGISKRYNLYPGWLNDGTGTPQIKDSYNEVDFIDKIPRHVLFTEIYDQYLASQIAKNREDAKKDAITGINLIQGWLTVLNDKTIPDKDREEIRRIVADPLEKFAQMLKKHEGLRCAADNALLKVMAESQNKDLTEDSPKGNNSPVKSELEKLIARVKRLASRPGAKAELARVLKVAPARVTEWLTDDREKRKEPGGHYTLELLHWVEQQERQK